MQDNGPWVKRVADVDAGKRGDKKRWSVVFGGIRRWSIEGIIVKEKKRMRKSKATNLMVMPFWGEMMLVMESESESEKRMKVRGDSTSARITAAFLFRNSIYAEHLWGVWLSVLNGKRWIGKWIDKRHLMYSKNSDSMSSSNSPRREVAEDLVKPWLELRPEDTHSSPMTMK